MCGISRYQKWLLKFIAFGYYTMMLSRSILNELTGKFDTCKEITNAKWQFYVLSNAFNIINL